MLIHVDGDVIRYMAGFAAQKAWIDVGLEVGGEVLTSTFANRTEAKKFLLEQGLTLDDVKVESRLEVEPEHNALANARRMLTGISERIVIPGTFEPSPLIVYLSGPRNFRNDVATIKKYKGNRKPEHKPVHAAAINAMLRREYLVKTSENQEADDDMAIAHYTMWTNDPESTILATIDKDMDQIPGWHYNFRKDEQYYVTEDQADYNFWYQMLVGDTVDNVQGVPGIGPVSAAQILAQPGDRYELVKNAYAKGIDSLSSTGYLHAMRENGRLLWLRREVDQDWDLRKEDRP